MSKLEKCFYETIARYCAGQSLLLGLSGGPDSMTLFYLLLEAKIPFEVAHIDHRWRSESASEADSLEQLCQQHTIPFHLKALNPKEMKGNLEASCRHARIQFFKTLCESRGLYGVALGHHAQDQAETVLKRVFEGASLPRLRGLMSFSLVEGLRIIRPLLSVVKEDILAWIDEKNHSYFTDPTNCDTKFLRGKMREELLPSLSKQFGKNIIPSLCRMGESAAELAQFIDSLIDSYRPYIQRDGSNLSLDMDPHLSAHPFLLKAVIKDLLEQANASVSTSILDTILAHIQNRSVHTRLRVHQADIYLHRGRIEINEKHNALKLNKIR